MAVGKQDESDIVQWFPGEATGRDGGGQNVSSPMSRPVRVIGPFSVSYDNPNIGQSPDIELCALKPNTVVIKVWAIVASLWVEGGGSTEVTVDVGKDDFYEVYGCDALASVGNLVIDAGDPSPTPHTKIARIPNEEGWILKAFIYPTEPVTAGTIDFYALIT